MVESTAFYISCIGSLLLLAIAYLVLRGTLLDITLMRENPWPILWYLQILWVLVPLMTVGYIGVENLPVLRLARPGTEIHVTVVALAALFVYVASLAVMLRVFGLRRSRRVAYSVESTCRRARALSCFLAVLAIMMLGIYWVLGFRHAFLYSWIRGESLLNVRLANMYYSRVPSQLISLMHVIGYTQAILAGYLARTNRMTAVKYFLAALVTLTAPGDKGLPVYGVILWVLSSGKVLPRIVWSWRLLRVFGLAMLCGVIIVYLLVRMQMPNMSPQLFGSYLLARFGVGQMAGVYETAGLIDVGYRMPDGFVLHMVPFASLFWDYTDYQKYLMMLSEGYGPTQMGVKNTFFLAEAYAMGGTFLAVASPIIVAFSTSLGLLMLSAFVGRLFGKDLAWIAFPIYFITHDLTGGFSIFPMFKGCILLMLQLGSVWLAWALWNALIVQPRAPL
jgi:hypothetical protein